MTGRLKMSQSTEYAQALTQKFMSDIFTVHEGRKFDKIVQKKTSESGASVHAFVNKETGDLIKPATWKAPQKSVKHPSGWAVRYNINTLDGFNEAINEADIYGGYLYEK